MLKEHEKFWAFVMLGGAIVGLAVLSVYHPIPEGSGSQRIVDAAMGGLLLALGSVSNALFRIQNASEQQAQGEATAKALQERGIPISNTEEHPVPVEGVGEAKPATQQPASPSKRS